MSKYSLKYEEEISEIRFEKYLIISFKNEKKTFPHYFVAEWIERSSTKRSRTPMVEGPIRNQI